MTQAFKEFCENNKKVLYFGEPGSIRRIEIVNAIHQTQNLIYFSQKHQKYIRINEGLQTKPFTTLMFHQTDGNKNPYLDNVMLCKSHILLPASGELILLHPLQDKVKGTLQGFISVEVAGKFPSNIKSGAFKNASLKFDKTHTDILSDGQKESIKNTIDIFIASHKMLNTESKDLRICFHCNTYKDRVFCCGQEIAKFAKDYAVSKGMKFEPDWYIDSGKPTHKDWL